ncbi:hypothetical protein TNCV_2258101 [Trichonephila clavipes]|nr:hypothetical protein TNCV_2258101 [Trichonephila clavipes]
MSSIYEAHPETTTRIETFVESWDKLLYHSVVEICRLGMEPACDRCLQLFVVAKTLTGGQVFLEVKENVKIAGSKI